MFKDVSKIDVANFLEGSNPKKYVVGIECTQNSNIASLIINDPEKGKYVEKVEYKAFAWVTNKVCTSLFNGNRVKLREKINEYNISFKLLKTENNEGYAPERMENGYKYLMTCRGSENTLNRFLKEGGISPYSDAWRKQIVRCKPEEQFMIQTGIRLFKGMDDYDDLHRLQFDLETYGIDPKTKAIFQVGMRDNKPYEYSENPEGNFEAIFERKGEGSKELRESERLAIYKMGEVIRLRKPDVITGYNSEDFDWEYLERRCEILNISFKDVFTGLDGSGIYRADSRLKLGSETINYKQARLWGYNILDISHAVRKTMAINSEIKSWSLKWITKFSDIAKKNRVYVPGELIGKTWADNEGEYFFNNTNGDWFKFIPETTNINYQKHLELISSGEYEKVTGAYVVQRYLLDDLWETEKVDGIYNQATFLMAKIIPTGFMRSSTMGTAGMWQLIMMAWSYENDLGVPLGQDKVPFVGGLSRLCEVGYRKNVVKLDYAALYPNTEITHDIFPKHDISGVMKGLLIYIAETRDEYKGLKGDFEFKAELTKKKIDEAKESGDEELVKKLTNEYSEYSYMASNYDKKQLPIKILANSFFGSFGAPHVFNWGDIDCAEETTCRGRQYLRLMVVHFRNYGFVPLVADTDGMNFAIPNDIDKVKYVPTGVHRFTEPVKGVELSGVKAVVAEFNDVYMIGRMGLDIDDVCVSTINFSRKNYANDILKKGKSKVKLVGNTIKSNKMPGYIEDFINKGIRYLLDDEGSKFVELYYETVNKVINYQVPLAKIASKARVKSTVADYQYKCTLKNKAGNPMPKQAHMELVIANGKTVNIGDTIYYINTGTKKDSGDLKTIKTDNGNLTELNCKLLDNELIENDPNSTTNEYNSQKYLEMLNKRIERLMVCFKTEVRDRIIVRFEKSKTLFKINEAGRKEYLDVIQDRNYFTEEELKLCNGFPLKELDQDDVDLDLIMMDDKEVEFWKRVGKQPNNMTTLYWDEFLKEYEVRKELTDKYWFITDKLNLIKNIPLMSKKELSEIHNLDKPPRTFKKEFELRLLTVDGVEDAYVWSKKSGRVVCGADKLFMMTDLMETIEAWLVENPKKKIKNWMDKYSSDIDVKHYFKIMFDIDYVEDEVTFVPRVYKDYDYLYANDDTE